MRISVGNIVMLRKMKIFCQNDCFLMFLKTLLLNTIWCLRWFAGWSCFILMILKRLWLQLDTRSYDPNLTCTTKFSRFETKTFFCKFMKPIKSMFDNSPVLFLHGYFTVRRVTDTKRKSNHPSTPHPPKRYLRCVLASEGIDCQAIMQLWEMQESHCKDRKDKMTKTWVKTNTKTYKTKNWRTKE